MNWKNLKNFLSILFLCINAFLLVLTYNNQASRKLSQKNIEQTCTLLLQNGIKIDPNIIPDKIVKYKKILLTNMAVSDEFKEYNISNANGELVIEIPYSQTKKMSNKKKIIDEVLKNEKFSSDTAIEKLDENTFIVTEQYEKLPIFNNKLIVKFYEDKIVLTGKRYIAKEEGYYSNAYTKKVYSTSALISFISYKNEKNISCDAIKNIEFGYYGSGNGELKSFSAFPCYRLTDNNGKLYYYNILRGVVVD